MSAKSGARQARQTKPAKNPRAAPPQETPAPERPPTTLPQLVTEHDVQLFRLSRAYSALLTRVSELEKRLESIETPPAKSPTFEDDAEPSEAGQLDVVVEES